MNFKYWLAWTGAGLTAGIIAVVFLYTTFQTKGEASNFKVDLDKRLERIEQKIDKLLGDI